MNSFRSKSHLCEGGFFLDELEVRDDSIGDSGADAVLDIALLTWHFSFYPCCEPQKRTAQLRGRGDSFMSG